VPLVLEVWYESAAGLRHDYDSQLALGGLFVPLHAAAPLEPFAPVTLLLNLDGQAPLRVASRLTVASAGSLCVEILPESLVLLGDAVTRACAEAPPGGSTARRSVRLLEEGEPVRAAPDEAAPLTLDKKLAAMSVGEKVRLASTGGRDERMLLSRDRAGVIQASLVRNPRVTVDEVLALARAPHLAPEAAEAMAAHKSWSASAQVSFALVRNPRTPLALAVETVGKLMVSDLRVVAKGTGVRAQVAAAARKRLIG
jgi:hypothetical protein